MIRDINIREARFSDLPTLLEMEQQIISAERPFDPTIRSESISYYDLRGLLEADHAQVVVAEHQEQLVASGYALRKEAKAFLDHTHYAYLGFMYTHPDYRGNGINGLILEALRKWASKVGLYEIRLTVYDENAGALRAYEKYGFKRHLIEMRLPT